MPRLSLLPTLYESSPIGSQLCHLASRSEKEDHDAVVATLQEAQAWHSSLSLSVDARLFSTRLRVTVGRIWKMFQSC
jgi:hypothetical protein